MRPFKKQDRVGPTEHARAQAQASKPDRNHHVFLELSCAAHVSFEFEFELRDLLPSDFKSEHQRFRGILTGKHGVHGFDPAQFGIMHGRFTPRIILDRQQVPCEP
jgi:hypothetical protein